jgi:hypothetical protein
MPDYMRPDLDLGGDVYVEFTHWSKEHHPDAPDPAGGLLWRPENERFGRPIWTLSAMEPLDLAPSFLCHCGFHGFIRQGRWVSVS